MKMKLIIVAFLGLIATSFANTYNFTSGDNSLFLGFYAAKEVSTKSVLINLGPSAGVSTGFTLDLGGASSALSSAYGTDWFNNSQVFWGLIGYDGAYTEDGSPPYESAYASRPASLPLLRTGGGTFLTEDSYTTLVDYVSPLVTAHNAGNATLSTVLGSAGNTHQISILDNSSVSFSGIAEKNFYTFNSAVSAQVLGALTAQQFTFDGISKFPTVPTPGDRGFASILQSNGIITISAPLGGGTGPGAYTGPWNWTAASGNWGLSNNWTNNQVASNGYAVGITGAGGTITNDFVTSLSSLTFSNTAGSYTLTGTNATQVLEIIACITNNSAATQTIDLTIAGAGGLTQSGTGTTVLSRSNSYFGGTTLSSGAVLIGTNNALGSGAVTVSGASALIAGTANLSTTNAMSFSAATTIDTGINRWTNAGTLSGAGSLTKVGSGTLTIAGTGSTFSGNTTLNVGALQVASNSTLGAGTVTVASGASLSGSGTVGAVILNSGGVLTGGVDGRVGKLTVATDLTFSPGGMLNWKIADANGTAGTGFDSFDIRRTLNLTGLTTGSTLQFNILNAGGVTANFNNTESYKWLVASAGSIFGFSTDDFTIRTNGFSNNLAGGSFSFSTNGSSGLGLYLVFTALGVDPWTGNLAAGSNVISGQTITSTNSAVIAVNSSRNGSVAVTNNGVWNVSGNLQVGGAKNGSGTLTIGSGGRVTANELKISDQRGSRGLVLISNGAASNAISLGSGTLTFGAGNGTLQFAHTNALTISNAISGKGMISSTGIGTTTLSGNQSGFTGTNYLSSGKVVLAAGMTNGGTLKIAGRSTNVVFAMNSNSVLSSTGTHAVAGLLLDNSGKAFKDSIKGQVVLAPTGVLQKTYTNGQSVAGFGAGIGAGKRFSLLAGSLTNAATLEAKITKGALDFKGTYSNNIVMAITDPSFSSVRNTIQWYDPVNRKWKNTIAGNIFASNKSAAINGMNGRSFAGSFDSFLFAVNNNTLIEGGGLGLTNEGDQKSLLDDLNGLSGGLINTTLAKIMGAFGYDNRTKTSWAVINHNSLYSGEDLGSSVIFDEAALDHTLTDPGHAPLDMGASSVTTQAVPEPSTWALMILGGLALAIVGMRRTRP